MGFPASTMGRSTSLDSTAVPWNTGGEWRLFSRDAVHIHAKIVSMRNREISVLGMYSPIWGEFSVK